MTDNDKIHYAIAEIMSRLQDILNILAKGPIKKQFGPRAPRVAARKAEILDFISKAEQPVRNGTLAKHYNMSTGHVTHYTTKLFDDGLIALTPKGWILKS